MKKEQSTKQWVLSSLFVSILILVIIALSAGTILLLDHYDVSTVIKTIVWTVTVVFDVVAVLVIDRNLERIKKFVSKF